MKPMLLLLLLLIETHIVPKGGVYICDSPTGKKYHYKNDCRGLSRCTHRIIEITMEEAKKRNLALCGFEK